MSGLIISVGCKYISDIYVDVESVWRAVSAILFRLRNMVYRVVGYINVIFLYVHMFIFTYDMIYAVCSM